MDERLVSVTKPNGEKFTDEEKYVRDGKGNIVGTKPDYLDEVIRQMDRGLNGGGPICPTDN